MSELSGFMPLQRGEDAMLTVEVSQMFDADADTVFALLSDVRTMAGLGPEHVAVSGATLPSQVGDTFVGHNRRGSREWQAPCTVHVYDPPRAFGWIVGDLRQPTATWTYELSSSESRDGTTAVRQRFVHGPGWSLLRTACERYPDRADEFVAARADELRRNMLTVLKAASDLLGQPSGRAQAGPPRSS